MFVIFSELLINLTPKCYIGQPINDNWVDLCELNKAVRFETMSDAKKFIKSKRLTDVGIKEIEE